MELKKLDRAFYVANPRVEEALDFDMELGTWSPLKVRGHGVVQISINSLIFAIPVRSNIRHDASFILQVDRRPYIKGMGLDYSKALLIRDDSHVSDEVFLLKSKDAGKKLINLEPHITKQFGKYVQRYISAKQSQDTNILKSQEYKYTTLINYHAELGL